MDSVTRHILLSEGKEIGGYWFNEKAAQSFITLAVFAQNNNMQEIDWMDKDRIWKKIPIQDAVQMCKSIIREIQSIYGLEEE